MKGCHAWHYSEAMEIWCLLSGFHDRNTSNSNLYIQIYIYIYIQVYIHSTYIYILIIHIHIQDLHPPKKTPKKSNTSQKFTSNPAFGTPRKPSRRSIVETTEGHVRLREKNSEPPGVWLKKTLFGDFTQGPWNGTRNTPVLEDSPP